MLRKVISVILIGIFFAMFSACVVYQSKRQNKKQSAGTYYELGVSYLSEGNYQAALVELHKAESLNPKDGRVYNALGLVHLYTKRYRKAEEAYRKALAVNPDYSEARMNLGALFAKEDRCPDAIEQFQLVLKDPFYETPALVLHNIGLCRQMMGQTEKAETFFKDAISLDPLLLSVSFDLWKLYYRSNRMDEAIRVLTEILERYSKLPARERKGKNKDLANVHYGLGLSYFKNADGRNALKHFRAARELSTDNTLVEDARKYIDLLE